MNMNDNYKKFFDAEPFALKYGENPHQKAFFYKTQNCAEFENLSDIELSYNNILDIKSFFPPPFLHYIIKLSKVLSMKTILFAKYMLTDCYNLWSTPYPL